MVQEKPTNSLLFAAWDVYFFLVLWYEHCELWGTNMVQEKPTNFFLVLWYDFMNKTKKYVLPFLTAAKLSPILN